MLLSGGRLGKVNRQDDIGAESWRERAMLLLGEENARQSGWQEQRQERGWAWKCSG